ncbi:alpha/beta hydrolase [Pseudomonas sp. GD03842]|uniref:alpha/beta fold hydrolase n=1 Tax=unclassified Pseudomonas TaxID=196821 RepID=UPI000D34FE9A|nr:MULTISPECIES: alpha/beta hydrolase [unclassified Pseudomonas]MDH0746053.1 alpha/beta hydrolase [Pseudomonas sp. GD03842]RAU48528.1 alpha/beta hydrolase [Pseudomonas sp. RIT 409]RAU54212.1 alpha/beta hydrolase [Pseudomonas sp. RIT 412]
MPAVCSSKTIALLKSLLGFSILVSATIQLPAYAAANPWEKLPETPLDSAVYHRAEINGIQLAYADSGKGPTVILLHGGPANSSYLSSQVKALKSRFRVVSIDTRGHGRSGVDQAPLGYDLFADDAVALMNLLHIDKAHIIGWSDGGITGLDMAMRYPDRVGKVVAFGANVDTKGTYSDADKKPAFAQFLQRASGEYEQLSPTPKGFEHLNAELGRMYATQPDWTPAQLKTIQAPVLVVDGEHDEVIKPEHTRYIAASIPTASVVFIPNTSHFAFIQAPEDFNKIVLDFLDAPTRLAGVRKEKSRN